MGKGLHRVLSCCLLVACLTAAAIPGQVAGAGVSADIPYYYISPTLTQVGQTVTFRPTITNNGATDCTFAVTLSLRRPDGTEIGGLACKSVTIPAGQQGTVTWTYTVDQAGLWDVVFEVWQEPARITLVASTGWMPDIIRVIESTGVSADILGYSISPTQTQVGETVTFQLSMANTGETSWTFWGQLSLRSPDGHFLNDLPCKPVTIAVGQQGTVTWTYTVDQVGTWDAAFGVWQEAPPGLPLDSTDWLPEAITVQGAPNQPDQPLIGLSDLSVSAVRPCLETARPGETITVGFSVRNAGPAVAAACDAHLQLTWQGVLVDPRIPLLASCAIPSLGAGGTHQANVTVTLPLDPDLGYHWLWVSLDPASGSPQTDYSNDQSHGNLAVAGAPVALPDLALADLSVSPSRQQGGNPVTLRFSVSNVGPAEAAPCLVAVRLSASGTESLATDLVLGYLSIPALKPGEAITRTESVTIPATSLPGQAYFWVIADPFGTSREATVSNNARAVGFTIDATNAGVPDLGLADLKVDPCYGLPGASTHVSFTVANSAGPTQACVAAVRISASASTVTVNDLLLTEVAIPRLDTGRSTANRVRVTIPSNLAPGLYYIWVTVDVDRVSGQRYEANDRGLFPFLVTAAQAPADLSHYAPAGDLQPGAASGSPQKEPGASVVVNGNYICFDARVMDGVTLAPVRLMGEALGARVFWDGSTQTVTLVFPDGTLKMQVGSAAGTYNDRPVTIPHPPEVLDGRVFVPVRLVIDLRSGWLAWDQGAQTVSAALPGITQEQVRNAIDVEFQMCRIAMDNREVPSLMNWRGSVYRYLAPNVVERSDQLAFESGEWLVLAMKTLNQAKRLVDSGRHLDALDYVKTARAYRDQSDSLNQASWDAFAKSAGASQRAVVVTSVKLAVGAATGGLSLSATLAAATVVTSVDFYVDTTWREVPAGEAASSALFDLAFEGLIKYSGVSDALGDAVRQRIGTDWRLFYRLKGLVDNEEFRSWLTRFILDSSDFAATGLIKQADKNAVSGVVDAVINAIVSEADSGN